MVSLICPRRAIPLYWSLLPTLGNSSFESQSTNLQQVLPLFSKYKVIVLGDREFCSVDLANWLKEKGVSFCLRLKKNLCIETEHLVWQRLDELGIVPGTSLYFQGKKVRKTRPATGFALACKWRRNSGKYQVKEAWFILTDAHCEQPSMLISSGWALKKCSETVKKEAMILKEQASKGTD
ncbi:transposase [Microcoleus sp. S13_B4]